ncbi:hypothetical protein MSG28_009397 [Choristoneura fumiferana]|uniref:Uncharacterized protein n=1 Tax=Choristoneura fumiferana TaxID=7141 RepID=A0ACC0KXZ0_CHOFU|nr:hypothetical protein MSG28_009397 [Choristoneura fumiferana]
MQSDEEDTLLHSCFDSLKNAVMGCCYSICHKETDPQFDRRRRANRLDREQPSQQVGYRALTYSRRCMNGTIVWNVQLVVVNDNVDF